jgi:hypothetical protein
VDYEKEKEVFLSCCGSYCHTCDWFSGKIRAQGEGTRRMLGEYANFQKLLGRDGEKVSGAMARLASSSICSGCQLEGAGEDRCEIRLCCRSKGFSHCSECPDFPCKTLSENPGVIRFKTLENLAEIKRIGWKAWADAQWREHVGRMSG